MFKNAKSNKKIFLIKKVKKNIISTVIIKSFLLSKLKNLKNWLRRKFSLSLLLNITSTTGTIKAILKVSNIDDINKIQIRKNP